MQLLTPLLAFATVATAHYNFPALIYNGVRTGDYEYVRQRSDYQSNGPVENVSLLDIRCGKDAKPAPKILSVAAGSTLSFAVVSNIGHPGPTQAYLAKVPSGYTAATWDGSGSVWFKIHSVGATFSNGQMKWPSDGLTSVPIKLPSSLASGDYLIKVEHIGLHGAGSSGGAQFYGSCGQITVTGGGSSTGGTKVAFPGAYSADHPGIKINIYWPVPTSYTPPGPSVWTG